MKIFLCCGMMVIKGSKEERKEANVLFNIALNTFYLQVYGIKHTVKQLKDYSDSYSLKGSFIGTISDTIAHTTAFFTPVLKHLVF